ncbi:hypothetical protein ACPDHL_13420 [Myroides sp. C15-4]|uniref:hypothetical protein n=1 Tax=Myroides sp. C15-4 TaxID=3400532 RepID=UPI003D2F9836
MKKNITYVLLVLSSLTFAQNKVEYLASNRFDLNQKDFEFPQSEFGIIGFGAYHGSEKTEEVEMDLLRSIVKTNKTPYYLPETDFSLAYFFNAFLKSGDTVLLKDLVTEYGERVPQERTIQVFDKWKALKQMNDELPIDKKINVVGIDFQVSYKYAAKHLLELIKAPHHQLEYLNRIEEMVKLDTTSYAMRETSYAFRTLQDFVFDYEKDKTKYKKYISHTFDFEHLIKNLKYSFVEDSEREQVIYDNYVDLHEKYDFRANSTFVRMGFFHLEKSREGEEGYPSFFTRLIENDIYPKDKVISIIGYLTDSEVVWDEEYDDNDEYTGYTIEGGMGIGDCENEYFRGIQHLKDAKISDKTLFRLNQKNSPYAAKEPDLIEIIMTAEEVNGERVKDTATLDYLDYAVLLSNSKASVPIFEKK